MGLKTTLLIVLTTTCATTGNGARLKNYVSLFLLASRISSPTQKMCQRLRTDSDCCLPSPYGRCYMNVYLCKRMICLYLNVRAYVHIKCIFLPHLRVRRFGTNCHDSKVGFVVWISIILISSRCNDRWISGTNDFKLPHPFPICSVLAAVWR